MQRVQGLSRDYGLSVPADVQAVEILLKDALVALGSSHVDSGLLIEHEVCEESKAKLEASLTVSESKLSDAQKRVQELELINDTVNQLVSRIDKAEKAFGASQNTYSILRRNLRCSPIKCLLKTRKR